MKLSLVWNVLKETFTKWSDDKAPKLAASLSFYTIFSIAPMLLLIIAIAGFVFGNDAAQGRIVEQLQSLVGKESAVLIQNAIKQSSNLQSGIIATVIGIVTLLLGASGVFLELQDSLNMIWKVRRKPDTAVMAFLKSRLISFSLIIAVGVLLMASLIISTVISALSDFIERYISIPGFVLSLTDFIISLLIMVVLFSMIYRVLPDVKLSWKDVRIGGIITSLLFILGKYLISLYLGRSSISSTFGAAGSLAVFIIWIYYTSQILFLGAEFTYVYAVRFGSGIVPK
ncbi:MAG: YihY/virulence factor BrkB family protein [Ignavibacteria bacterium]|jgi:membrane protein|nr:YihY/virulence factor BrkB family protein [Ignavibacteria bacterium]MCU7504446.1 YihY/virulence factor BrkB family protein [Ignavibacteria bacterium]MCU7517463.1 YihY/virulence factor BrkB family protein [Ignavibacteria bacterium]